MTDINTEVGLVIARCQEEFSQSRRLATALAVPAPFLDIPTPPYK
jgi:hypothetical protein